MVDRWQRLLKKLALRGRPLEGRVGRFVRDLLWFEDRLDEALEADSPGALGKNGLDREEGR